MKKKLKKKIDKILYEAHLIVNAATGTDISKTAREQAKRDARKKLKEIKELDEKVWGILKAELD